MCWMSAQRSLSGRCFQAGIAPRPVVIFQNSAPSVSSWTRFEVQSAGFGFRATAAAPSPLPREPWHDTQFTLATFSPCSATFAPAGIGLFLLFSDSGAVHGVAGESQPQAHGDDDRADDERWLHRCSLREHSMGHRAGTGYDPGHSE